MANVLEQAIWIAPPLDKEEIVYPDSDGQGMPDGDPQREAMFNVLKILERRFEDDPNVYITGNSFVYYVEGDPTQVFSPDVMVVKGVPRGLRDNYKFLEEGDRAPSFVMEIAAKTTYDKDLGRNKSLYRLLRIPEYVLYDYTGGKYYKPPLQGFRLVKGNWVSIARGNTVKSEELGIEFRLVGDELHLHDAATGERLLPAEAALKVAEQKLAEAEARAKEEASARQRAEARIAELVAELERLKRND